MQETDRPTLAAHLAVIAEAWGRNASEILLRAWWVALSDLPVDAVLAACKQALQECEFMPAPATIRRMAVEEQDRGALARYQALEERKDRRLREWWKTGIEPPAEEDPS